jgi:hypothetical protein
MSKPSNNNLLTIGEMFKTVAGEFKITRKLGQGATGEVYQAQSLDGKRTVAIKMMRPTNMQLARKLFIGEGLTLAQMRSVEKKAGNDFFVTPEYFGADDEAEPPYIVEEFMTGKPFPDLVSGGHLSEDDVVTIGVQLFRTLHLLSKELKKNYIDLKFENLWWDHKKKTLKITDWGTLEETNSAGQARDILRASLYIYRLATGQPITESRGILNQSVDDTSLEWKQLSWGMQEILRRLLHPTPSARVGDDLLSLDSAEKIAQEFKNLDEYWTEPADELLADIRRSVDAAQKANPEKGIEQQTLHYRLARTALEIALKRGIPIKELDIRLQSTVMSESDYFTRAHNLYEGTSYAPARKLFQIGAELLSLSKLRRWAWLAYAGQVAGEDNYKKVKVSVEDAVEKMEQEQYGATALDGDRSVFRSFFDAALKTLPSEALQTLRQECEALNLIQQAISAQGNEDFGLAEKSYRDAHAIWFKTDDHDAWKDKVGDLLRQADTVRNLGEKEDEVSELLKEVETAHELSIILDKLQKALRLAPGNSKVYTLATKLAGERFDAKLFEDATRILWVGGIASVAPPDAIDWRYPEEIRLALDPEKGDLRNAKPYVPLIRHDANALPYKLTIALFEKHFIPATNALDLDHDDNIADLMMNLDSERGNTMKEQVQGWGKEILKANKEKVNQLVAEAEGLLFDDRPGALLDLSIGKAFAHLQNRLQVVEKALGLLDQASRLAGSEEEALKSKIKELEERGIAMEKEYNQSLSENKEQKEKNIAALTEKAEEILAQLKQLEDASPLLSKAGLPSQISDSVSGYQTERLGKVYELCTRLLESDSENQWALETQQRVRAKLDGLGDYAALAIVSQKKVLDAAVEALLREAHDYYENGKVLEAARSLRKIEAVDSLASSGGPFIELKAKVTTLMGVKYWEQENKTQLVEGEFNPQFLERIATHFSPEIPLQFRRDSASFKYIFAVRQRLFTQLLKINPVNSTSEFAETLRNLVWTDNLYRRGLTWQNNQKINQKDGKWDSKKFVRNVLQVYKEGNLGKKMEKLLGGLPIFPDSESRSTELTFGLINQMLSDTKINKTNQSWWKWVLVSISLLACIAVLFLVGVNWKSINGVIASLIPTPVETISTATPTATPTATSTAIATPTATPTATSIATLTPSFTIRICTKRADVEVYKIVKDFTTKMQQLLGNGDCLNFDARVEDAQFQGWFRIAPGNTNENFTGGWVMGNRLNLPSDNSWKELPIVTSP